MPKRLQEAGAGELDHASEELISVTECVVAAASVPGFKLKRRHVIRGNCSHFSGSLLRKKGSL